MKKILLILVLLPMAAYLFILQPNKISMTTPTKVEREKERDKLQNIGEAMEQEFERTKDPQLNTVPRERLLEAYKVLKKRAKSSYKAAIPDLTWEERGPNNVGGRTRSIWIDPNNTNRVLAGSVGGGLWETTNFKTISSWTPHNDFFDNLTISTIAQAGNTDVLYFGTGEGWFFNATSSGLGIWKSTDRGSTWTHLESTNNSDFNNIQQLKVDAAGILYAATRNAGLQRSTDGGLSWTQVLGSTVGLGSTDRAADIEIATNGDIYASLGIFTPGSLFKSTSGVLGTWTNITPPGSYERIEIAAAPSNANRVYILCQDPTTNQVSGIFRTDNGGLNWNSLPIPTVIDEGFNSNFASTQAWYDLIAAVDPNNANRVYIGGLDALGSNDAGASWEQITTWSLDNTPGFTLNQNVHADHHEIIFFPGSSSDAIWGTDGGLDYTTNLNVTGTGNLPDWGEKNNGYNVTQFYSCAIHPTPGKDYFLAGTQDNGTQQFNSAGINSTIMVVRGDGGFCHIDQDNPNIQIATYIGNDFDISIDGGVSFNFALKRSGGSFINPNDYDNDSNILYAGNGSNTFFRWNNPGIGTSTNVVTVPEFNSGQITHVRTSEHINNRVYFGLNNGTIVRVEGADIGTNINGTILNPNGGNGGSISSIDIEQGNENHLLVTYSNYGVTSVYESVNGGLTWTTVEGNLPDMPVRWGIFNPVNPNQVLLATELGVWSTDNLAGGSTSWGPSNIGLANVRTDMLAYRPSDNIITAATYGRGLYSTDFVFQNVVNFGRSINEEAETGTVAEVSCDGINNENTKTIQIPVNIAVTPATDVVVDITIDAASTATINQDYQIISPTTLTFTAGGSISQNISVKILDDAIDEVVENLILNLDVNTGGTVINGATTTYTLNILDDEDAPSITNNRQIIWTEDFEEGGTAWLNDNPTGNGHNLWAVTDAACGNNIDNQTAIIGHLPPSGIEECGYGSYNEQVHMWRSVDAAEFYDLDVTFDWVAQGEGTLFDYGTLVYSTNIITPSWTIVSGAPILIGSPTKQTATVSLPSSLNNTSFLLGFRWQVDGSVEFSPALGFDNVTVRGGTAFEVETTIQNRTSFIAKNETAYFYSDNQEIIASIQQTGGAIDIGCVTLEIDNAGSGKQNIPAIGEVTDKTFLVTAENDAPYIFTAYFRDAELSVWGGDKLNLNMVKTSGSVAESGTREIILNNALTVSTYGAANNIAYAYSGTTFSGFALTNSTTALAIDLLSFKARAEEKTIRLDWTTLSETNHDYFLLERSNNNTDFRPLTKVEAKGNGIGQQNYTYLDRQPFEGRNYYRLTPIDFAGQADKATIAVAEIKTVAQVNLYPNPGKNEIWFSQAANYELFDAQGRLLTAGRADGALDVSGLGVGVYFVKINGGELIRWVKQ